MCLNTNSSVLNHAMIPSRDQTCAPSIEINKVVLTTEPSEKSLKMLNHVLKIKHYILTTKFKYNN